MTAVIVLVLLGIALWLVIGLAVKFFGVEADPRIDEVEALLPNANCGACGFAGCADFARALVGGDAETNECPSNSDEAVNRICALLGIVAGEREAQVAVVLCGGDSAQAAQAADYNGVNDCRDAMLVAGGAKGCLSGCLGLGTCARACPFGAIEMTESGIARIHAELCTGCGKCVATCPRHLIELVPGTAPVHVLCSSPAKGGEKRKVCKVSCIGCRKCVKTAEEGQMTMDGFLARVNYDDPPGPSIAEACPTGCLQPAEAGVESAQAPEPQEVVNG